MMNSMVWFVETCIVLTSQSFLPITKDEQHVQSTCMGRTDSTNFPCKQGLL